MTTQPPREWAIYRGEDGLSAFRLDETGCIVKYRGNPPTLVASVIEKSAYDALAVKAEAWQEGEQFYRREWESACERLQYANEGRDALAAENEQLRLAVSLTDLELTKRLADAEAALRDCIAGMTCVIIQLKTAIQRIKNEIRL